MLTFTLITLLPTVHPPFEIMTTPVTTSGLVKNATYIRSKPPTPASSLAKPDESLCTSREGGGERREGGREGEMGGGRKRGKEEREEGEGKEGGREGERWREGGRDGGRQGEGKGRRREVKSGAKGRGHTHLMGLVTYVMLE